MKREDKTVSLRSYSFLLFPMQQSIVQSRACRYAMIWPEQMFPQNGKSQFAERKKIGNGWFSIAFVVCLSCLYVHMFGYIATLQKIL